jgi:hypothetical protein
MKERNVILRGVVPVAVALLIFVGLVLAAETEIEVSITPHHLSLSNSYVRFVRCNVSSEYDGITQYNSSLSVDGKSIGAVKVESHIEEHDTTVVFFDVDGFNGVREMLDGKLGEVTLTLSIDTDGDEVVDLEGTDTIIVVE